MSGHDPQILEEAKNDPAFWLSLVGMALPNVLYSDPYHGSRVVARPGAFLNALGQAYDAKRGQLAFERQASDAALATQQAATPRFAPAGMQTQTQLPQEAEGAMYSTAGPEAFQAPSLASQAKWQPNIESYGKYLSKQQGPQLRTSLDPKFKELYGGLATDANEQVLRQKLMLSKVAGERWLKNPDDEDAGEAMRILVGDVKNGYANMQTIQGEQARRSSAWMLSNLFGYDPEVANRMSLTQHGPAELERMFARRQEQIQSSAQIAALQESGVPENELAPLRTIVQRGGTLPVAMFQDRLGAAQMTKFIAKYPKIWETLSKGIPIPPELFQKVLSEANTEFPLAAQRLAELQVQIAERDKVYLMSVQQLEQRKIEHADQKAFNKEQLTLQKQRNMQSEIGLSLSEIYRLEQERLTTMNLPSMEDAKWNLLAREGKAGAFISHTAKQKLVEGLSERLRRAQDHFERTMLRYDLEFDPQGLYYADRAAFEGVWRQIQNPNVSPAQRLRALDRFELSLNKSKIYSARIPGGADLIAEYEQRIKDARAQLMQQAPADPGTGTFSPPSPQGPFAPQGKFGVPGVETFPELQEHQRRTAPPFLGPESGVSQIKRLLDSMSVQMKQRVTQMALDRYGVPPDMLSRKQLDDIIADFGVPGKDPALQRVPPQRGY